MKTQKTKDKPLFYISERPVEDLLSGLKQGTVLRGRVVRMLPSDKAIVRIRGLNLVAENHGRLKKGERFRAKVKRLGLPLALTLLKESPSDEITFRLREIGIKPTQLNRALAQALLSHNLPLNREEMESLLSLWERVSPLFGEEKSSVRIRIAILCKKMRTYPSPEMLEALKGEDLLIGQKIDELIHLSAHLGETLSHLPIRPDDPELPAKLKRLPQEKDKALLRLSSLMKGNPSKDHHRLRNTIDKMKYIGDLESLSHNSKAIIYQQIPIQEGNKIQTCQLKIERRDTSIWLGLLGEIRGVGRVEIEALLDGEKALLKVWTEKEKTASLLEERLPELRERLKILGLRLSAPLIWQRKISLSPLSFLISPREETIDLKG